MKHFFFIYLVLLLICFTGCSGSVSSNHHTNPNDFSKMKEEVKKDINQTPAASKADDEKNQTLKGTNRQHLSDSAQEPLAEHMPDSEPITSQGNLLPELSEDELSRALQTAGDYYRSIHREPLSMKQTQRNPRYDIYEDYDEAELICFEVSEENAAEKRYITLGSKDNWNSFEVLNEGY